MKYLFKIENDFSITSINNDKARGYLFNGINKNINYPPGLARLKNCNIDMFGGNQLNL